MLHFQGYVDVSEKSPKYPLITAEMCKLSCAGCYIYHPVNVDTILRKHWCMGDNETAFGLFLPYLQPQHTPLLH